MRDRRFVAEHRGGPLSKKDHHSLALWAAECAERAVTTFWDNPGDQRPHEAVAGARAWARGDISVGEARKAAIAAHASARETKGPSAKAAARSAGHAAATAHAADHCLGAGMYALRAVEYAGKDRGKERQRQDEMLPDNIRELVLSSRSSRKILG